MEWSCGGGVVSAIILVHAGIRTFGCSGLLRQKSEYKENWPTYNSNHKSPRVTKPNCNRTERSLSRQQ